MLDVALHNSRQHRQFHHGEGALVLARMGSAPPLWLPVDSCRTQAAQALLEIVPEAAGIEVALSGCESEFLCGRSGEPSGHCRLPVPATFAIGDTRFEIWDTSI